MILVSSDIILSYLYVYLCCREELAQWLFVIALLVPPLVQRWPQHAVVANSCYLWDFWRCFCDHNVIWKTHVDDQRYILMRHFKTDHFLQKFVIIRCALSSLIGTLHRGKWIRLHYNWGRLWRLCGCISFIRSSTLESSTCWSRYVLLKSSG